MEEPEKPETEETVAPATPANPANAEAAKLRHKVKERDAALAEATAELAKLRAANEKAEQDRLAEAGKFKELFEAQVPKIKELESKASAYDNYVAAQLAALESTLPAEVLAKVPASLTGEVRIQMLELLAAQRDANAAAKKPEVVTPVVPSPAGGTSAQARGAAKMSLGEMNIQMSRIASDPALTAVQKTKMIEELAKQI